MSQLLQSMHDVLTLAAGGPAVPDFTPTLPDALKTPTGEILGYTAGGGLSGCVLGGLSGWAMIAIGHNSERPTLAARGKAAIVSSGLAAIGIAVTSGLVLGLYSMAKGS
ncbi:hypothetical protein [Streptomyces rubradiris]|uniref:Uncharacterized protein n=1 Tax=Streptomyces rubradiris TaxID=285531 RepID=A0ABQ3RA44_STRRR|nr:hypothetical protein [Streptomyces rubradiris]GHH25705.1 hypothetical protein GCM10018792_65030 [Streptomyces rubradiris]GHI52707.1 hypothetical protein Srubr_25530 [Streptomyces rubradiris]